MSKVIAACTYEVMFVHCQNLLNLKSEKNDVVELIFWHVIVVEFYDKKHSYRKSLTLQIDALQLEQFYVPPEHKVPVKTS